MNAGNINVSKKTRWRADELTSATLWQILTVHRYHGLFNRMLTRCIWMLDFWRPKSIIDCSVFSEKNHNCLNFFKVFPML